MKEIFIFISGVFASKLIEDNLPNMHYKNIAAGFDKHMVPVILIAYFGYLSLLVKITRSPQVHKSYFDLLTVMVALMYLSKEIENKKIAEV